MGKYIARRLIQMIPVIIGTTFLIYALVFSLPGDPTAGKCGQRPCSPEYVAQFRAKYNLNDPLPIQYVKYMEKVAHGDLGESQYGIPIRSELKKRFWTTFKLGSIALIFEAVIGIGAGALSALRKGGILDNLVLVSSLTVISIPIFVIGSVLQLYLGVRLGWFPVTVSSAAHINELLLPGFVLGSISIAYLARLMRSDLSEAMRSDYVRTANAKGLSRRRIVGVHAMRNSLIPVITFLGYDFGSLLGGAIITEGIFNIQGIGGYTFQGIHNRDGMIVVGTVTALVLVYVFANLIVDLIYGLLDPRISHD